MYLVLTALLALNVSSEILAAFRTINKSIGRSNQSISRKNNDKYKIFEESMNIESERAKVAPYYEKAKQVKASSEKLISYLEAWKTRVVERSGGYRDTVEGIITNESDLHASTDMLVDSKGGDTIKSELLAYRQQLLRIINEDTSSAFAKQLPLKIEEAPKSDANPRGEWSAGNFYNMPVIAVVTLLSKFQNDIKNSEAMIIDRLFEEIHALDFKFDAFKAIAVPKNSYLLEGQKVEAEISLAAYNKSVNPTVSASSGKIVKVEEGVAHWESTASGKGLQTIKGVVSLDMGGKIEQRPYEFQYMVGTTGASLQLDKMNVFYIGVDNPVTVSAAGYSMEDISLNIPGATVSSGGSLGKYSVRVTTQGKVTAAINAKTESGPKQVGAMEIRVKMIPDPIAKVGGKTGSFLEPANRVKVYPGIVAALDNFDFEARFMVTSFNFTYLQKRQDPIGPISVNGPLFSANKQVQDLINKCKAGDKIFLDGIRAKGPDGVPRALSPIIITVN